MAQSSTHSQVDKTLSKASVKDAAGQVQDVVEGLSAQAGRATEGMQEVAGNVKGAVDKSMKDQPMATLAVAAMAGFVLGALWKS
jgi:ElaB/YqjD/DUF883 family membrane-anchored ribosome-binding protein